MLGNDPLIVHSVQLISGKDQNQVVVRDREMHEVLSNRIRGALVPSLAGLGLLGGQDLDEAPAEGIELVGLAGVAMHRGGIELGQQVDLIEPAIEAIADRDVHESVHAGEGHGRLGALSGERAQTGAASTADDDCDHALTDGHSVPLPNSGGAGVGR